MQRSALQATLPGKPGNTWKWLEFILHLEKHLENSILGKIYLEIPGKIFSCCRIYLTANHKIDFFKQCT